MLLQAFPVLSDNFIIGVNERDIYRYKNSEGMWQGKDIALIKAVFRRTSHQFTVIEMPWPRVLESIKSGQVDMTLAATRLPEREMYALFSESTFRYSHYMLFAKRDRLHQFSEVKQLKDLENSTLLIGALRGAVYTYEYYQLLKNEQFVEHLVYIGDDQSMVTFALKGRVDAYIDSEIEGKHYLQARPEFKSQIVPLFRISTDEEAAAHLMFSKKSVSPSIVQEFDLALKDLHESGEYEEISEHYDPPGSWE